MSPHPPMRFEPPLSSIDAAVWARVFLDAVREHPQRAADEQFVSGWFRCALATGQHYGAKRGAFVASLPAAAPGAGSGA
jgi:hypothetical protein